MHDPSSAYDFLVNLGEGSLILLGATLAVIFAAAVSSSGRDESKPAPIPIETRDPHKPKDPDMP